MSSQIYRSNLSDRRFASFTTITANSKSKWTVLLASMVFHFILPGIFLSYGIILVIRVNGGLNPWEGMITPSVFYISWTMADPWFRDAKESWAKNIDVRVLSAIGVIIAFSGVAIASISALSVLDPIFVGLLGGLGTSLVFSQIDFVLADMFETNLSRVKCFCKIGQAVGQCVMPYILLVILDYYEYRIGLLVVSGIIIQILPMIFLIKPDSVSQPLKMKRDGSYARSYSLFNDSHINANLSNISSSNNNIQMVDLSPKTWKSPSDENIPKILEIEEDSTSLNEENVDVVSEVISEDISEVISEVIEDRPKNIYGVEILPQIIEESEETSDSETYEKLTYTHNMSSSASTTPDKYEDASDRKQLTDDIKRLSVISDKLDILIQSTDDLDVLKDERQKAENGVNHVEASNSLGNIPHLYESINWFNHTRSSGRNNLFCGCYNCPSYEFRRFKRNTQNTFDKCIGYIVDPFVLCLKTLQFYPALLLKLCSLSMPFNVSCLVSLLINDKMTDKTLNKIAFFTTLHGAGWLCILTALPCILNRMSKSRFKYFSSFGMFIASIGMFGLMKASRTEFIALSSATVGIGYGFISTTNEDTLRESIGLRKWSKLRGKIDCVAGVCLGLMTSLICYKISTTNDIEYCFGIFTCLLILSGLCLIAFPLATAIRKYQSADHAWPHIYE